MRPVAVAVMTPMSMTMSMTMSSQTPYHTKVADSWIIVTAYTNGDLGLGPVGPNRRRAERVSVRNYHQHTPLSLPRPRARPSPRGDTNIAAKEKFQSLTLECSLRLVTSINSNDDYYAWRCWCVICHCVLEEWRFPWTERLANWQRTVTTAVNFHLTRPLDYGAPDWLQSPRFCSRVFLI